MFFRVGKGVDVKKACATALDCFGLIWIFGWQVGLGVNFRFWILDFRLKKSELAFMGVQGRSKVRVGW